MTILQAIDARHSVRAYREDPIPQNVRDKLDACVGQCNTESGLHISVKYDDPDGFDSRMAHYGNFRNVRNYIVLAGKKSKNFKFLCGYYGEKIVLYAQQLGLNTCWTALTFNKKRVKELVPEGESLCMVIALGYGETQGQSRPSKTFEDVTGVKAGSVPLWFLRGVDAALKAPTAMNQQKFRFTLKGDEPYAAVRGAGPYTFTDLGIVVYHFEAASGRTVNV